MKRGLVLVEGQTEERFVNECLGPYLLDRGLALQATIVRTKRVASGGHFKGGVGSFDQVQRDLGHLRHDTHASVITTLFDYYAIPTDFPGMAHLADGNARARVERVEAAWALSFDDPRFQPHLVLHELEAWVFADPARLEPWMFDDDVTIVPAIAAIAAAHATPEDIDDGPHTAPSKRLLGTFAGYQKPLHGPIAFVAIGIEQIRATCPHFAQWLDRLVAIGAA